MSERTLTLWAAAKLNLSLAVGACRADGYHEIRSVMQKISLYDTLQFRRAKEITFASDLKYLPSDERNLCVRAAKAYFEAAGISGGVEIRVRKAIPVGAGLGGGSADAACTLRALQALYGPLEEATLFEVALSLGADVPFCLSRHATCLCEGIGEKLTPIEKKAGFSPCLLLLKNDRKLSTADVYRAFDEQAVFADETADAALIDALKTGNVTLLSRSLFNHLEGAVISQKPSLSALLTGLLEEGALGVRMSGAGPTVYGIFPSAGEAERASKVFSKLSFCRIASFL